jgi:hypothetical protein
MLVQASQLYGRLADLTTDGVPARERIDYWREAVLWVTAFQHWRAPAALSGFREMPTFTRMFKRRYGITPRDAREIWTNPDGNSANRLKRP